MEMHIYRQGDNIVQKGVTVDQLPAILNDPSVVIWVDMESPTVEDERILLDLFKFHPLTVEDCHENRHYPKIEEFPGYLYFIVHGVRADTSPRSEEHTSELQSPCNLVCRLLLEKHKRPVGAAQGIGAR